MRESELLDTIAAISTPPGYGGISIVRMSGPRAIPLVEKIFMRGSKSRPVFIPFTFSHGYIKDPKTGKVIDECLILCMRAPASYTGEDVIEIQCHGGNLAAYRILALLLSTGARMAEPGEFTRRAFMNGKKDLSQAEAVESIIHARTEFQQENALSQLRGELSNKLGESVNRLRNVYLELEAEINFPEEADVDQKIADMTAVLSQLDRELSELEQSFTESRPFVEGLQAVIIGKPNVGKSSFLNCLLEYERAIVSVYPGTTRDFIKETMILEGLPIRILDTAGIRNSEDPLELEGMRKTASVLPGASVIFALFDASRPLDNDDRQIIEMAEDRSDSLVFALLNKIDLGEPSGKPVLPERFVACRLSLATGEGIDAFRKIFRKSVNQLYKLGSAREIYLTTPRHYAIVSSMRSVIKEYQDGPSREDRLLFTVSELLGLLDRLTGRKVFQDEINEIFSRFCIGK